MVVCVATAKMDEFMLQLSYEHETAQVKVPVNPVKEPLVKQEHIFGYCMKCRAKVKINKPHHVITKNWRHAIQGICPRCGTKIFRFKRS